MRQINHDKAFDALTKLHTERIREYRLSIEPITFGSPINVMLVSDSYYYCAKELKKLLEKSSDINKVFIKCLPLNAIQMIMNRPFDFLIYVGPMAHRKGYKPTQFFHMLNQFSVAMMYAPIDDFIKIESYDSDTSYAHDLFAPIDTLIPFMREAYAKETALMHSISPDAKRSFSPLNAYVHYRDPKETEAYYDLMDSGMIGYDWEKSDEINEWVNDGDWSPVMERRVTPISI